MKKIIFRVFLAVILVSLVMSCSGVRRTFNIGVKAEKLDMTYKDSLQYFDLKK